MVEIRGVCIKDATKGSLGSHTCIAGQRPPMSNDDTDISWNAGHTHENEDVVLQSNDRSTKHNARHQLLLLNKDDTGNFSERDNGKMLRAC